MSFITRTVKSHIARSSKRTFSAAAPFVVNSHNEFDPLEEVIVGRVEGSTIPEWHVSGKAVWPEKWWDMYKTQSGQSFPPEMIQRGKAEQKLTIC